MSDALGLRSAEPPTTPSARPTHVVGIGASAGGLEALEHFFRAMPIESGFAFVIVLHLSPDFRSMMPELLRRCTRMEVRPADGVQDLEPNTVYVLLPGHQLAIDGQNLQLISTARASEGGINMSINHFFDSLAGLGPRAIAIVLSGTGSDGSLGIQKVRQSGGFVLAQSSGSARFDGMPRSALDTGSVDAVLEPEDMPEALAEFVRDPKAGRGFQRLVHSSVSDQADGYGPILDRLRATYDIDFSHYKAATIVRRIERRLKQAPEALTVESYARRLREDREELDVLYSDLLIGVTRFFRDESAFKVLNTKVIEPLIQQLSPRQEVRAWVCGCSTGEEAYSIGILIMEAFEARGMIPRLRILATDLHASSLQFASAGLFTAERLEEIPEALRSKYFTLQPSGAYKVTSDLRKAFIFSPHNLIRDAAFTRMDVVSCRNMLIYLQPQAQLRALASLHSALKLGGTLFLGESESPGEISGSFEVLDRDSKLFRKATESRPIERLRSAPVPLERTRMPSLPAEGRSSPRVYDLLLERYMPVGLLVSPNQEVVHVFGDAGRYVTPASGRFRGDVGVLLSGALRTAVLVGLRGAAKKGERVTYDDVEYSDGEETVLLRIAVDPIQDVRGGSPHFMVVIERRADRKPGPPVPFQSIAEEQGAARMSELESELESLRERLQHTVEEVEASNQELQAGNEELIASNEELQSTNEELHAVNEELYTVNAEHEQKIRELNAVTADLNNLIRSTGLATLFLDTDLKVRLFTPEAQQVFRLLPRDVGRDLRDFTPREIDAELFADLEKARLEPQTIERELEWSDGRHCLRRITPYRDMENRPAGLVLTYLDVTEQMRLRLALREQELRFRATVESAPAAMVIIDEGGTIVLVNAETERLFGYGRDELLGKAIEELLPQRLRAGHPAKRQAFFAQPQARRMGAGRELFGLRKDGTEFPVEIGLNPIHTEKGVLVVSAIIDITERKRLEARLRATVESAPMAMVMIDRSGAMALCNAEIERLFGYERDELLGQPIEVLIPERFRAEHPDQRTRYFRTPEARRMGAGRDLFGLRKDGTEFPVEIGLNPIQTDEGSFVLAAVLDLTERKRAEEELRRANEALTRSNLAQQQFIYIVSHDLREPINTINNFAGLLLEDGEARIDATKAHYLDCVRQGAERIRTLLDDLLGYVRLDRNETPKETVDLNTILADVTKDIRAALEQRGATLRSQELPTVIGQASMLRVLLQNLIDNATKFHRAEVPPEVEIHWREQSGGAEIVVADNGIGIEPAHKAQAFELFRRLHPQRRYPGTGIGLAMCKKIVELHGGRIWIESRVDQGTEVHLLLPKAPALVGGAGTTEGANGGR